MMTAPVKNLTEEEVLITLRLLQLQVLLGEANRQGYWRDMVVIHRDDPRLVLLDDKEKFLAMLIDCDLRVVLLTSKRCRSRGRSPCRFSLLTPGSARRCAAGSGL